MIAPRIWRSATVALALAGLPFGPLAARRARAEPQSQQQQHQPVTVTLEAERATLTLGSDLSTVLTVTVSGAGAEAATAGPTQATVGTVEPLAPTGAPGTFTTVYHLPPDHRPEAALVSAEVVLPGGVRAHAATVLRLPAAATFPLRTEPNAIVTLQIGDVVYGPVTADANGNVGVPIVVPPGVETGRARATSRYGATKETEVDLQPRDYPRVLLLAPAAAEAGATAAVEAWGLELDGTPVDPEEIDLRASAGKIRRATGSPGVARFLLTVPEDPEAGAITLTASMSDGTSERSDTVAVHAGPPATLLISSSLPRLHVGSAEVARLTIVARDHLGNEITSEAITVTADGRPLPIEMRDGVVTAELAAPARWAGQERTTVLATLEAATAKKEIPLTGTEPAGLVLRPDRPRVVADGQAAVDIVLDVTDRLGTPTTTARVAWRTQNDGTLVALPPPRFGSYAVRFVPARAFHDQAAVVTVTVDSGLTARSQVLVETAPARAVTARVGLIPNLGGLFGETAFLEATWPWRRDGGPGRLFSLGVALGYIHSELSTPAGGPYNGVHVDISQTPLMALGRFHLPLRIPFEVSLVGVAGGTIAATQTVADRGNGGVLAQTRTKGLLVGAGADLSFALLPGEVVLGARYLAVDLARLDNGDQLQGNAGGLVCDVGFTLPF